ncbi:MAG TPA: CAP domain-containing protein [Candidatus Limnocylindria bacterium]|nr:CAP domain-containing protein [Candidatus Limnocylindria bacterium]
MSTLFRSFFAVLLAAVLVASIGATDAAAAQGPSRAEARLHSLINGARENRGLVRLPWDRRLADVAQFRSNDMARNNYFAHPTKAEMAEMLEAKGIAWRRWGETLAWNSESKALNSAERAFRQWRNSSVHWNLLMSDDFNYIAIGLAQGKDGRHIWTALLLKGPDRTAPRASMVGAQKGSASAGKRRVTVSWTGRDVKLQVLTSGLKDFRLQRRVGSGKWRAVTDWTTATSRGFELAVGKTFRFRIRARDNAGNVSTWSAAITVKP